MKQNSQTERVRDSGTQALSERLRATEKVRPREIESQIPSGLCCRRRPLVYSRDRAFVVEETSRRDAVPICVQEASNPP